MTVVFSSEQAQRELRQAAGDLGIDIRTWPCGCGCGAALHFAARGSSLFAVFDASPIERLQVFRLRCEHEMEAYVCLVGDYANGIASEAGLIVLAMRAAAYGAEGQA